MASATYFVQITSNRIKSLVLPTLRINQHRGILISPFKFQPLFWHTKRGRWYHLGLLPKKVQIAIVSPLAWKKACIVTNALVRAVLNSGYKLTNRKVGIRMNSVKKNGYKACGNVATLNWNKTSLFPTSFDLSTGPHLGTVDRVLI